MGSSQPAPRVGNLSRRRCDTVPDTMGSSQPTPPVGNRNRGRRDAILVNIGSGSGMQQNETGSSHCARPNSRLSGRNSSLPPIVGVLQGKPSKRQQSTTIQTTAYTQSETKLDGQGHLEAVPQSDDSIDEYQASYQGDKTEPDTEHDIEEHTSADSTQSGCRRQCQAAERQGSPRSRTVRIPTTSRSQRAALVRQEPPDRVAITRGRAFMQAIFLSSSVGLYLSSLPLSSDTASSIGGSNPPLGDPKIPVPRRVPRGSNSRGNIVTGVEGEIVGGGK